MADKRSKPRPCPLAAGSPGRTEAAIGRSRSHTASQHASSQPGVPWSLACAPSSLFSLLGASVGSVTVYSQAQENGVHWAFCPRKKEGTWQLLDGAKGRLWSTP